MADTTDVDLDLIFAALANADRLALIDELRRRQRKDAGASIAELARQVELSRFSTSRHLRILREAGLVSTISSGRKMLHAIASDGFARIEDWFVVICDAEIDDAEDTELLG